MAAIPALAEVIDFRTLRRDRRELGYKNELRARGIHTRELVLLHLEATQENMEHWHRKAMTARYLNGQMLDFLRLANVRCAESQALLASALAECERLKALVG